MPKYTFRRNAFSGVHYQVADKVLPPNQDVEVELTDAEAAEVRKDPANVLTVIPKGKEAKDA